MSGEVDLYTAPLLSDAIDDLLAATPSPRLVVLDLLGVTFIDSVGLGVLVRFRRTVLVEQGRLVLVAAATGRVAMLMKMTGLLSVFEIVPSLNAI